MCDFKFFNSFYVRLAGVTVNCAAHFDDTWRYFKSAYIGASESSGNAFVTKAQLDFWPQTGKPIDAGAEFSMLSGGCSDALLPHSRFLIHAVAFRYREKAYLIAAAPGVGKSTQIRTLMELYPDEFSVICGDRPILECRSDGSVFVHPSPWNGKEDWSGADGAPLGGIFFLERGAETSVEPLSKKEAVLPFFRALISTFETEETIARLAQLEEQTLQFCPTYCYVNGGVPDSSRFLYEHIFAKEDAHETDH